MGNRILLADDEPKVTRLLQLRLEARGYVVDIAQDGREALQKLDAARPDLVILDVGMPIANGFEVLEIIRTSEDTKDIPVIMATAWAEPTDIAQGWRSGADCYLTKPLDLEELTAFVERILHPPADQEN